MSDEKRATMIKGKGERPNGIRLSAPWNENLVQSIARARRHIPINGMEFDEPLSDIVIENFVRERTRVHETYIIEKEKSKRFGLFLAFALIVISALIVTFAPPEKETISYWIGGALLIFAAGATGFKRIWGKTKSISLGADMDKREMTGTEHQPQQTADSSPRLHMPNVTQEVELFSRSAAYAKRFTLRYRV